MGKTTLLVAFTTKTVCTIKISGLFEVFAGTLIVDSNSTDIECWYTSPAECSEARHRCYRDVSAVLICFAADDYESFENAKSKWYQEACLYAPNVPIFLVKTKSDSEYAPQCEAVSTQMGEAAREDLRAIAYMECSSYYSNESVQKVFEVTAHKVRLLGVAETVTKSVNKRETGTQLTFFKNGELDFLLQVLDRNSIMVEEYC